MNPRIWSAYRRTLCLARTHCTGSERAFSVLRLRNVARLEYLKYEDAKAEDVEALVRCHEHVNDFLDLWWQTWEDPLESDSFKKDWARSTRSMDEEQAKQHYKDMLQRRVDGMREFNQKLDEILASRPDLPDSAWRNPEPAWKTP